MNIVNLNLVQLPKAACLNPAPSYYKQFNGFTLGLAFAMLSMYGLFLLGKNVIAPVALKGLEPEEYARRVGKFQSNLLGKALLILYIVYPGVSVSIFGIFSCTSLASGVSYLDQDFTITCYDAQHYRYLAAAIIWLFVVPVGVPYFFTWLLRKFRVPEMAQLKEDCAWLQEAAQLAWTRGLLQEGVVLEELDIDTISDAHLEALYALFVAEAPIQQVQDIFSSIAPPVKLAAAGKEGDEEAKEPSTSCVGGALAAAKTRAKEASLKLRALTASAAPPPSRRSLVLAGLLNWCRTGGELALPVLEWEEEEEDAEADAELEHELYEDALAHEAERKEEEKEEAREEQVHRTSLVQRLRKQAERAMAAAPPPAPITCAEMPKLQKKALQEVGFLFGAYHTRTWYWESVELMRKLALTSILALISPGSAGQPGGGLPSRLHHAAGQPLCVFAARPGNACALTAR